MFVLFLDLQDSVSYVDLACDVIPKRVDKKFLFYNYNKIFLLNHP